VTRARGQPLDVVSGIPRPLWIKIKAAGPVDDCAGRAFKNGHSCARSNAEVRTSASTKVGITSAVEVKAERVFTYLLREDPRRPGEGVQLPTRDVVALGEMAKRDLLL
jgi:hypothetical protein